MDRKRKHIVVVGGGFAGINFIKSLANEDHYCITLVDQNNYHFFPPLLYQVGMAFIEPSSISYPFRRMFQQKRNVRFHLGRLVRVNPTSNTIETESEVLHYDYLVLAMGTETNYFGMENVRKNSWPLKTIDDAINLRNHLLCNLEKAVRTKDPEQRKRLLNVVVAGGGPTGVEVAGMLSEMAHKIGPKEYPEIVKFGCEFSIFLIEASGTLLSSMSVKAQQEAYDSLKRLGVIVKLNTAVKDYVDGKVMLASGESIATDALVWTSGVIGSTVSGLEQSIGAGKRILVDEFCKAMGTENIFAIGDIALYPQYNQNRKGHPQVAQVAIQQGKWLGTNFKRLSKNMEPLPFKYRDKGNMAIISKYKAVVDLPGTFVRGVIAWLIWLFIHLIPIAGFRNKVRLALNWGWSFITDDPTLRLIIRPKTDELKTAKKRKQPDLQEELA